MSIGYYLHDIGKVLIPIDILNKKGRLTAEEFALVKTHSYGKGIEVIEKNNINNPFITNSIRYHHSAIFNNEEGCYPDTRRHHEIPIYVKVCKLADIYDAMTSKRSYKEAVNPINVVAEIFHKYARKDPMLQVILHAFVTCIGIHPPGSIVFLEKEQMAYVLDSKGPIIIPFTDKNGVTLKYRSDPIDLGEKDMRNSWKINTNKAPIAPIDVYNQLPSFLK
jgi:HD-GYP domain-containing protein (c-di-GMP phosphodiesterase class II)